MQRKSCYKAIIQSMSPDNIINHESEHQVSVRLARLCNWFTTSRDAYQPVHCYQGHIKHEHTLLNINIFKDSDVLKHRLLLANGFCSPWQNKSKAFWLWPLFIFHNYCIAVLDYTHFFPSCKSVFLQDHYRVLISISSVLSAHFDTNNLYWISSRLSFISVCAAHLLWKEKVLKIVLKIIILLQIFTKRFFLLPIFWAGGWCVTGPATARRKSKSWQYFPLPFNIYPFSSKPFSELCCF